MKIYIVYVDGVEIEGYLKAKSHNDAERKAKALYPLNNVSVTYTEI
jgi:hypothetical protein